MSYEKAPRDMTVERLIECLRLPPCLCSDENRTIFIAEGVARLLKSSLETGNNKGASDK